METMLAFIAAYTFATASLFVAWFAAGRVTVYEKGARKCSRRDCLK